MHRIAIVGIVSALVVAPAGAGPDWDEQGDAGSLISTAQVPIGMGPLNLIRGSLSVGLLGGDFQDVYCIEICDPTTIAFSAGTDPSFGGTADFATRLFLFDSTGLGLLGNEEVTFGGGSGFGDMSTDGTGITITAAGIYYIAISGAGSDPLSTLGPIFSFTMPLEVSGPDGIGGASTLAGWTGPGAVGDYEIAFTGTCFPVPGPGALAMLGVFAGAWPGTRRRR